MSRLSLAQFQAQFTNHLLSEELTDNSHAFVELLQAQCGQDTALEEGLLRLGIYRNNVIHSLSNALGDLYPVVKRLIGDEHFNHWAVSFVRKYPPSDPALVFYGQEFIDYLTQQESLQQLAFLSDIATFEYAQHRAFHSEDINPLDLSLLGQIAPERLGEVFFTKHPSVTLLESPWSIDAIWRENLKEQPQVLDLNTLAGESLLIYRLGLDVQVVKLNYDCYQFLSQLINGKTIEQAWALVIEKAQRKDQVLDQNELSPMLGYLLSLSVFTHCELAHVEGELK